MNVVVVGVGNAYRRDDGVGLEVAERMRGRAPGVEAVAVEQEPSRLLDAWAGAELAIVVDAVSSSDEPGTVHRFDASEREEVERMTSRAADAVETFITSGIAVVMNKFNGSDPAVTE